MRPLPRQGCIKLARIALVAQDCILPYRRLLIGLPGDFLPRSEVVGALFTRKTAVGSAVSTPVSGVKPHRTQVANLRYSRLQTCATAGLVAARDFAGAASWLRDEAVLERSWPTLRRAVSAGCQSAAPSAQACHAAAAEGGWLHTLRLWQQAA